ncbi:MAG TPA: hypothetical protein VIM99_04960 [Blastocatellia bacterium]
MKKPTFISRVSRAALLVVCASMAGPQSFAQSGGAGSVWRVIGEVRLVDRTANKISVKTDAGEIVDVAFDSRTTYLKTPPGQVTLDNASKASLSDVAPQDRIMARGRIVEDKTLPANQIIVMSRADIQQARAREQARWRERGIVGVITAVPSDGKLEATARVHDQGGARTMTLAFTENTRFRRYAPDSVNFEDAKPSSFADIKAGDQVRALGDKTPDGSRAVIEEIVSGSFLTVSGSVIATNAEAGEVKIAQLSNRRPLAISLGRNSKVRRASPQMIALLVEKSLAASTAQQPQNQPKPATAPRGPDLQELFEQAPQIPITEIKPGEIIIVSSAKGSDPSKIIAIAILTGVDQVFNQLQARATARARTAPNPNTGLPPGVLDLVISLP